MCQSLCLHTQTVCKTKKGFLGSCVLGVQPRTNYILIRPALYGGSTLHSFVSACVCETFVLIIEQFSVTHGAVWAVLIKVKEVPNTNPAVFDHWRTPSSAGQREPQCMKAKSLHIRITLYQQVRMSCADSMITGCTHFYRCLLPGVEHHSECCSVVLRC